MGHFDFLIDKGEKPKDMEYIYMLDIFWKNGEIGEHKVNKWSPVKDVVQQDSGRYEFTFVDTGVRGNCTYAWALAENTPENRKAIDEYNKHSILLKEVERLNKFLWNKVATLKNTKPDLDIDSKQ
jgi:hypothetical protein